MLDIFRRTQDSGPEASLPGAAMTLYHNPLKAEETGAVVA